MTARRTEAGFTLVEMLVALSLFALVAGIGTLMAFTAARSHVATGARLASAQALLRARAILTADLAQAAPRVTHADTGATLPAFMLTRTGFVLVRRGVAGVLPSVRRVAWGWDGARLVRQSWATLDGGAPEPPVTLLTGVTGVRVRVATTAGWSDAWRPQRPQDLPRALELTLGRDGGAVTLRLLVAA